MSDVARLLTVADRTVGDELDGDHAAGVGVLLVGDAYPFIGASSLAVIADDGTETPYDYTAVDDDASALTLVGVTSAAYADGTRVEPRPVQPYKLAQVRFSDGQDAVDAVAEHTLAGYDSLVEGAREADEIDVEVEYRRGALTIVGVVNRPSLIPSSSLTGPAPDGWGQSTDGIPPLEPPTVEVINGVDAVFLKVTAPANPDPITTFTVYGPSGVVTSALSSLIQVTTAVLSMSYDADTAFTVSASDGDGEGPQSAPVVGRPVRIDPGSLPEDVYAQIDAAGTKADDAQAAADQAAADALAAANAAAAAQSTANAAETPTGAQDKANIAASTAYTLAVDAAAGDATSKATAAQTAAQSYADTQVATKGKVIAQVSAPTGSNANANNLWIDTSGTPAKNTPNRWNGSAWEPITDKVASDAAAAAYAAQQTADAAAAQASTAITAANGKNSNTFSGASTPPATTGRVEGDVHTQVTSGRAVKQWVLTSGAWVVRTIDGAVLTNIDAASITTGFLNVALLIQAGAITTEMLEAAVIEVGDVYGQNAYLGAVSVNQLTAGTLSAVVALLGALNVGDLISLSPPTSVPNGSGGYTLGGGIVIKDPANPTGEPLVRLHPMGCSFKGKLTADIITVLFDLVINGNARLSGGSTLTAANGVPDPLTGPAWTVGPQVGQSWPAVPSGHERMGIAWAGSQWYELLVRYSDNRAYARTVSTGGVAGTPFILGRTIPAGQSGFVPSQGFAVIGSNIYYAWSYYSYPNTYTFLTKTDLSGALVSQVALPAGTGVLSIGPSGTAEIVTVQNVDAGASWPVVRYNTSLVETGRITPAASWMNTANQSGGVLVGNFDFGSERLVISRGTPYPGSGGRAQVWTPNWTAGTLTENVDQTWQLGAAENISIAWDGANFQSLAPAATNLDRWTSYRPSSDSVWSAVYADKNGTGTTKASPPTTATVPARNQATLTLGPAPDGITGADVWVGYAASGDAATKYKRAETLSGRTMTLTGKQTTGSTTIPSTSTAGGAPAIIRSGADDGWKGSGNGSFTVKDAVDDLDAVNKRTMQAALATFSSWGERESLAAYATGVTVNYFDIRRNGKDREIRGSLSRSLAYSDTTDVATGLPVGDRPANNTFGTLYVAGGYPGMTLLRSGGTLALINMNTSTRSGSHQFTLKYTVE